MRGWRFVALSALVALIVASCKTADGTRQPSSRRVDARNIELVGHSNLNGNGDGGEGLVIQQWPDGRRWLYLAHEAQRTCLTVIDVTRPEQPTVVTQLPSPAPGVTRCNSLGLSGTTLAVANQTLTIGAKPAGVWMLDVSDPARVQKSRTLQDLSVAFFDTSGPHSRGAHCLWFVDGEFMHVATGMPDFEPTNPLDDQIYLIVDVRNPRQPKEVGRWWYPGTWKQDTCLPGCLPQRNAKFDTGYRPHETQVWPDHPDRVYVSYIDGGAFVMDISSLAAVKAGRATRVSPKVISHLKFQPPYTAWTHTFQPIFSRGLAFVSDESTKDNCEDAPKLVWLVDIRAETNPVVLDTAPFHETDGELCKAGGRFGAHNIHPNFPMATSAALVNTTVASWFNGGVRIFHIADSRSGVKDAPPHLEEIGHYIPAGVPRPGFVPGLRSSPFQPAQINHAIVDERGLIYANERSTGGLYILRYTGKVPLN